MTKCPSLRPDSVEQAWIVLAGSQVSLNQKGAEVPGRRGKSRSVSVESLLTLVGSKPNLAIEDESVWVSESPVIVGPGKAPRLKPKRVWPCGGVI